MTPAAGAVVVSEVGKIAVTGLLDFGIPKKLPLFLSPLFKSDVT
jgi:hypothetical protein